MAPLRINIEEEVAVEEVEDEEYMAELVQLMMEQLQHLIDEDRVRDTRDSTTVPTDPPHETNDSNTRDSSTVPTDPPRETNDSNDDDNDNPNNGEGGDDEVIHHHRFRPTITSAILAEAMNTIINRIVLNNNVSLRRRTCSTTTTLSEFDEDVERIRVCGIIDEALSIIDIGSSTTTLNLED